MARIVSELIYKLIADETDLIKGLKKAEKANQELAKSFIDTGKKLSLGLTVPIVAAGAAMVKLASDTGEALNAANVVFKSSSGIIEEWGKKAAEQAGLTAAEFYQASAVIGAGLTNAGASTEEAARQTIELTKRAADMASIFNTSVDDALKALQSGLRGEAEPLRRFAISLDEASVQAKAAAMGLVGADGAVTAYGKSQARLALIMEQSAKFQGDFVNTSEQLANKTRITIAMVKEQAAQLGQQLLPIVLKVVTGIQSLARWFSSLSEGQKTTILAITGIAAAIGPMLIGIGNTIKAVSTLKIALIALQAAGGPITLIIAGVAALAVGLAKVASDIKRVKEELKEARNFDAQRSAEENRAILDEFKAEVNYAYKIAREASGISDRQRAALKASADALAQQYREFEQQTIAQEKLAKKEADAAAEAAKKAAEAEEAARKKAEQEAIAAELRQAGLDSINAILDADKTEAQNLQAQIDALKQIRGLTKEQEASRLAAIEILNGKMEEAKAKEIANIDAVAKARGDALGDQIVAEAQHQLDLDAARLKEFNDFKTEMDMKTELYQKYASQVITIFGQIKNIQLTNLDSITNKQLANLDAVTKKALESAEEKEKRDIDAVEASSATEEEKIKLISEIEKLAAEQKTEIAKKAAEQKLQFERDAAIEKAKIERQNAIFEKATTVAQISIDTYKAVMAVASAGPLAMIAMGALGAAQAALAIATPLPEIPTFAQGGSFMVPPGFNGDTYAMPAAMLSSGERVTVETPEQQAAGSGVTLQVGTLIADPAGIRELDRMLKKYGAVETARRG